MNCYTCLDSITGKEIKTVIEGKNLPEIIIICNDCNNDWIEKNS